MSNSMRVIEGTSALRQGCARLARAPAEVSASFFGVVELQNIFALAPSSNDQSSR